VAHIFEHSGISSLQHIEQSSQTFAQSLHALTQAGISLSAAKLIDDPSEKVATVAKAPCSKPRRETKLTDISSLHEKNQ
jgi:hypothetical protein